jgi:lambda family phage portal protein
MIGFRKQSFGNRLKEAARIITGRQTASKYRIRDLRQLTEYVTGKVRSERIRNANGDYSSAGTGRLRSDWGTTTDTPYTELKGNQLKIVARSRNLYKNDSLYSAAINAIVDNVVGCGLWPKPKIKDINGKLMPALNKKVEDIMGRYLARQWDARKKWPFIGEGQRVALRTIIKAGDVFLNAVNSADNTVLPISWQMFEIDRLDDVRDNFTRNNSYGADVAQTMHGINIDANGKEVSYWIKGVSKPIPAAYMIHSYAADRPEQYIGLPAAVSALNDIYDKHELVEDYVLKSRSIAKIMWFLSNENADAPGTSDVDSDDVLEIDSMSQLRGEKAPESMKMPDNVSDTVKALAKMLSQGVTSALGTSYTTATRDLEGVSFSGAKFTDIQEWRHFRVIGDFFAYDFLNPFYERNLSLMVAAGLIPELNSEMFRNNPDLYMGVEWVGNGKMDVDPLRDMGADVMGLKAGVLTYSGVLARRGIDFDEHIEALADEARRMKEKGIIPVWDEAALADAKAQPIPAEGGNDGK